jgi:hypothetical protein
VPVRGGHQARAPPTEALRISGWAGVRHYRALYSYIHGPIRDWCEHKPPLGLLSLVIVAVTLLHSQVAASACSASVEVARTTWWQGHSSVVAAVAALVTGQATACQDGRCEVDQLVGRPVGHCLSSSSPKESPALVALVSGKDSTMASLIQLPGIECSACCLAGTLQAADCEQCPSECYLGVAAATPSRGSASTVLGPHLQAEWCCQRLQQAAALGGAAAAALLPSQPGSLLGSGNRRAAHQQQPAAPAAAQTQQNPRSCSPPVRSHGLLSQSQCTLPPQW